MTNFSVWAPNADSVALYLNNERIEMKQSGESFEIDINNVEAGTRYGFCLDGRDPIPDPRSPYQPGGVHGLSATVDHSSFSWTDGDWRGIAMADAVIYELHVGTFTEEGTFRSAIEQFDYLKTLGITAIEIMPVAEFPGDHGWGYDGVDLYAPHHAYGGPEGLKQLVNAAHQRDLAVFLDVVYNHLGPDGNFLAEFGPYFTDKYQTPWGSAVNYDGAGSDGVRAFVIDNALMWLRDYHFDGLRLDAVHALMDTSAAHVVEELAARAHELESTTGRRPLIIAENDTNDPRIVTEPSRGGFGLDAVWSDDFHHALHARFTAENEGYYADFAGNGCIEKALRDVFVYDGQYSRNLRHQRGKPAGNTPRERFVVCTQNHDQVGNRARGERSSALMSPDRLKAAAALMLLGPFTPLIFAGEEWGATTPFLYFTDHTDKALGAAVANGRRNEFSAFGWHRDEVPDPQDEATFRSSKLDWTEVDFAAHAEMLSSYRMLLELRRLYATTDTQVQVENDVVELKRGPLTVLVNIGEQPHQRRLSGSWQVLFSSGSEASLDDNLARLSPDSVVVATNG